MVVLVIEDTSDARKKFWDDADAVACRGSLVSEEFYKKYSPGNLLTEFKGRIADDKLDRFNKDKTRGLTVYKIDQTIRNPPSGEVAAIFMGKEYHVLILHVPTEEGEEK